MALALVSRTNRSTPAPVKSVHKTNQVSRLSSPQLPPSGVESPTSPLTTPSAIQAKLKVSQPNDKFEQEADRVADTVMRTPDSVVRRRVPPGNIEHGSDADISNSTPSIQRLCTECATEEDKLQRTPRATSSTPPHISALNGPIASRIVFPGQESVIQRQNMEDEEEILQTKKAANTSPDMQPGVETGIASLRGGGQPLSQTERSFFEPRFGQDFSHVRIHTDSQAAESAHAVHARAFTIGQDVVFGASEYAPATAAGQRLLAHELIHVVQQNGVVDKTIQRKLGDKHDLLAERFQGRLGLEAAYDNERYIKNGSSEPDVVILQLALIDAGYPLPGFGADGRFGSETEEAVMNFQRDHGLQPDGIVGFVTMEVLDGLFTVGPVIAPSCDNPGVARTLRLQPVFFKCGANDTVPTGGSFFTQLTKANKIWSKVGVTFTTNGPIILDDCSNKTKGTTPKERLKIGSLYTGEGIEVFFVDNDIAELGGAWTRYAEEDGYVVMSDLGTSETLLAHELGHVLGLGHPPDFGENGTIMQPVGSHSVAHSEKNTLYNYAFIFFPEGTDPVCLTPDPTSVKF